MAKFLLIYGGGALVAGATYLLSTHVAGRLSTGFPPGIGASAGRGA
jgi:hypothetical protein